MPKYLPGDEVTILDTSNDRRWEGVVRRNIGGAKTVVYVIHFKNEILFQHDLSARGRFRIVASRRNG